MGRRGGWRRGGWVLAACFCFLCWCVWVCATGVGVGPCGGWTQRSSAWTLDALSLTAALGPPCSLWGGRKRLRCGGAPLACHCSIGSIDAMLPAGAGGTFQLMGQASAAKTRGIQEDDRLNPHARSKVHGVSTFSFSRLVQRGTERRHARALVSSVPPARCFCTSPCLTCDTSTHLLPG